jgi:hypothetical protein
LIFTTTNWKGIAMETFTQPKVTGYRQLSEKEASLMNQIKTLAVQAGSLVALLRGIPPTPADGQIQTNDGWHGSTIDQRWVSVGATDLQTGFMALTRAVAQPTTF